MASPTVCLFGALLVIAVPVPPERMGQNLIVNGSFEDGPAVAPFKSLNPGATEIRGWTVTRGQIDYVESVWPSADGRRSLDLGGSPGFGGVKQAFPTVKGQRYRVTFSLAGNPGGMVREKKLGVTAAGYQQFFTFDTTGKTLTDMGWQTRTWEFIATGDEATVEFFNAMTQDPFAGPALDNVSVQAVGRRPR